MRGQARAKQGNQLGVSWNNPAVSSGQQVTWTAGYLASGYILKSEATGCARVYDNTGLREESQYSRIALNS